uniref:Large ribosomal subunit protein bL9m n=1 Tax=Marmota marmota marmota TaxID=9994 RepID=A0A8C5ZY18_MARMA
QKKKKSLAPWRAPVLAAAPEAETGGSGVQSQPQLALNTIQNRGTVVVERWWKVPLAGEGRKPRLHRRHRVYKLVEDTKHRPKENLELILTQSVEKLGVRGDLVSVSKSLGRNRLLPQGLAVYASPENRKLYEEEKLVIHLADFFLQLGVVVAPHALKLPEEPITRWGEYWCEVTVNGLDTVRVPMSVVNFEKPRTKRYKFWLAQQAAKGLTSTSSQTL